MTTFAVRVSLMLTALFVVAIVPGCESEHPSEIHSYVDAAGRSCTVDIADISGTASCDVDASTLVTCEAGQEAEIVINDDYDFETRIWTLESCPACVDRAERTSFIASAGCALVECDTDMDCMYERYTCQSGVCRDM